MALTQAEINALLLGVDMGSGQDIVLTMYGHEKTIDKIAVSSFGSGSNARTYCDMIRALKLEGDSWVYAKIIPENTPLDPFLFIPRSFSDLILNMDNRGIQKVLREVDNNLLAKALKGATDAVLEKIFQNMSKNGGAMFREDSEYMGPIRKEDVEEGRERIISIIRHLADTGEIVIAS